jgi:hypothetical protein
MRKWNASMPREKAREGGSNVVLAFRQSSGERVELECKMLTSDAQALLQQAIAMMHTYKEPAAGGVAATDAEGK